MTQELLINRENRELRDAILSLAHRLEEGLCWCPVPLIVGTNCTCIHTAVCDKVRQVLGLYTDTELED